jgi:hypothetical protein
MMKQLGSKSLIPCLSGNENTPNHANYDEAVANPCSQLPGVLTQNNGKKLITPCVPWLPFISYGIPEKGDAKWLDQLGSYMSTVAAGSVFKLLSVKDIGVSNDYMKEKMPPVLTGLLDGELAWRQHDGGHTDAPNFQFFIPWASKLLKYNRTPLQ